MGKASGTIGHNGGGPIPEMGDLDPVLRSLTLREPLALPDSSLSKLQ